MSLSWMLHIFCAKSNLFVQNANSVRCLLIRKGQAAVKNTSRQRFSSRSIRKRNQSTNFSQHKKDQARVVELHIEIERGANVSLSPWCVRRSFLFSIFALRDTNQILMLSASSDGGPESFHQTFIFEHALTDSCYRTSASRLWEKVYGVCRRAIWSICLLLLIGNFPRTTNFKRVFITSSIKIWFNSTKHNSTKSDTWLPKNPKNNKLKF